jgi:hypothetical protein
MVRIICTIFFFLTGCNCISQIEKDNFYSGPAIHLRTNPFTLVEHDAGIMLGVNYRWAKRWSATVDPTLVFYRIRNTTNGSTPGKPLGVRVKTDLRYHIQHFWGGFENVFISPELVFGYINTKKTETFGINCSGPNCAYYMIDEYNEIKKEIGAAIKMGLTGPIKKRNENWRLELYLGIGVSYFDIEEKGVPAGGSFIELPTYRNNFGNVIEADSWNVMVPFGLKISLRIK